MDKQQVFEAWAPQGGDWSPWAKPVLFAHLSTVPRAGDAPAGFLADDFLPDLSWAPPAGARVGPRPGERSNPLPTAAAAALVLDLPGAAGVWFGAALAGAGYRPVPLYNACPDPGVRFRLARANAPTPAGTFPADLFAASNLPGAAASGRPPEHDFRPTIGLPLFSEVADRAPRTALVDVDPILWALAYAAPRLASRPPPPHAPPAFLLDANRRYGPDRDLAPGRFDNRSVSFPTDFPSANLLLSRGIRRAVLVQASAAPPQADLTHTLRRWQEAGIRLEFKSLAAAGAAQPYAVAKPSAFRSMWHRLLIAVAVRRNPLGGFGGTLPDPSAG